MSHDQVMNELKILGKDSSFISKNFKRIESKYREKFIAVRNEEILASDGSFIVVVEKLKEMNIDPSLVIIEFIPTKDQILVV